ncbi:MAG TPA: hypothetical protein VF550_15385 [Polyangia bacterium]
MMSRLAFAEPFRALMTVFLLAGCHSTLHTGRATDAGPGGAGGVSSVNTVGGGAMDGGAGTGGIGAGGNSLGGLGGAAGIETVGGAGGLVSVSGGVLGYGGAGGLGGIGQGGRGGSTGGGYGGGMRTGGQAGATIAMGGIGGGPVGGIGGSPVGGIGGGPAGAGGTRVGGASGQGGLTGGIGGAPFGGLGGQPIGGTWSTVPIGDRPSDWTPPFDAPMGDPGWQDSTSIICKTAFGFDSAFDVWADERGVFAMASEACSDGNYPCTVFDVSVQLNSGTGWQLFHQFAADTTGYPALLGGFSRGPLIVQGTFNNQGGLAFLDQNGLTYQGEMGEPVFALSGNAVGDNLVYASGSKQMFKYSAGTWSLAGAVGPYMRSVWTDGQTVIAVGDDQAVFIGQVSGGLTTVANVPVGDYKAVWGLGPNDFWLGNSAGQLMHFDGSKWQAHETGSLDYGIRQLWGDSGILYFATQTEFGRWNGSGVEMLLKPPAGTDLSKYPGSFGRFWGRSANEVFLPLRDSRYKNYTCGSAFMLYYDGAQFHSF